MIFSSTLLPQKADPVEIQKAILDLLQKINSIAGFAEPLSNTTGVGSFNVLDVASGSQASLPTAGTYEWIVLTYGATYGGAKVGIAGGGPMPGSASTNLSIYYKRIA